MMSIENAIMSLLLLLLLPAHTTEGVVAFVHTVMRTHFNNQNLKGTTSSCRLDL